MVYFDSLLEGAVHHSRKDMVAGVDSAHVEDLDGEENRRN